MGVNWIKTVVCVHIPTAAAATATTTTSIFRSTIQSIQVTKCVNIIDTSCLRHFVYNSQQDPIK